MLTFMGFVGFMALCYSSWKILVTSVLDVFLEWSGGAMVLGKLPVPGRPTIW